MFVQLIMTTLWLRFNVGLHFEVSDAVTELMASSDLAENHESVPSEAHTSSALQ